MTPPAAKVKLPKAFAEGFFFSTPTMNDSPATLRRQYSLRELGFFVLVFCFHLAALKQSGMPGFLGAAYFTGMCIGWVRSSGRIFAGSAAGFTTLLSVFILLRFTVPLESWNDLEFETQAALLTLLPTIFSFIIAYSVILKPVGPFDLNEQTIAVVAALLISLTFISMFCGVGRA